MCTLKRFINRNGIAQDIEMRHTKCSRAQPRTEAKVGGVYKAELNQRGSAASVSHSLFSCASQ